MALTLASTAGAAPPPVYRSYQDCQVAGQNAVGAAGGPGNLSYQCQEIPGVPAGVAGCPPNAGPSGCIGDYYELLTSSP
ncbi:hypothetical protein [Sciscionella marina]|uniref:hypothetical protein n=1 Tax=Sciscionella marina TaxID=508770 RepID=UPI00146AE935|nr:hypothetical protein [Sciscionella marina]